MSFSRRFHCIIIHVLDVSTYVTCEWEQAYEGEVGQCDGQGEGEDNWPGHSLEDEGQVQVSNSSLVHLPVDMTINVHVYMWQCIITIIILLCTCTG